MYQIDCRERGNLVVCLDDKNYMDGNLNIGKSIKVETGLICLFPASLLIILVPIPP